MRERCCYAYAPEGKCQGYSISIHAHSVCFADQHNRFCGRGTHIKGTALLCALQC